MSFDQDGNSRSNVSSGRSNVSSGRSNVSSHVGMNRSGRRKSLGSNYEVMNGKEKSKPVRKVTSSGSLLDSDSIQIYSQESILSAMDRFVNSVNNMTTCILVPSKLRDLEISQPPGPTPKAVDGSDMYQVYRMLNGLKQDFIYGPESSDLNDPLVQEPDDGYMNKERSSALDMEQDYNLSCSAILRSSCESHESDDTDEATSSSNSCYESGSEEVAEIMDKTLTMDKSLTMDKGLGGRRPSTGVDMVDPTVSIANQLKYHLRGMQDILIQLSDSADFITTVYQDEIEGEHSSDPCATSEQLRFKDRNYFRH